MITNILYQLYRLVTHMPYDSLVESVQIQRPLVTPQVGATVTGVSSRTFLPPQKECCTLWSRPLPLPPPSPTTGLLHVATDLPILDLSSSGLTYSVFSAPGFFHSAPRFQGLSCCATCRRSVPCCGRTASCCLQTSAHGPGIRVLRSSAESLQAEPIAIRGQSRGSHDGVDQAVPPLQVKGYPCSAHT